MRRLVLRCGVEHPPEAVQAVQLMIHRQGVVAFAKVNEAMARRGQRGPVVVVVHAISIRGSDFESDRLEIDG